MSTTGYVGFFLFYLDLELFAKVKKDLFSTFKKENSFYLRFKKKIVSVFYFSHFFFILDFVFKIV